MGGLYIFVFAGFVVSFVALLIATVTPPTRIGRWVQLTLAYLGLLYEAGCFKAAAAFGGATGNGDTSMSDSMTTILTVGFFIIFVWSLLLAGLKPVPPPKEDPQTSEKKIDS